MLYHDIQNDIAPSKQPMAFRSYLLWMLTGLIYTMNVIATIALTASGDEKYHSYLGILLSVIYLLICPVLAFYCWHYPLYKVLKSDKALGYIGYFISFGIQMGFAAFLAIGFFAGGGGGLLGAIDMFTGGHLAAGVLSLACTLILGGFILLGLLQLKEVARLYRHGGQSLDKARNEMLQSVASNPHAMKALFTKAGESIV